MRILCACKWLYCVRFSWLQKHFPILKKHNRVWCLIFDPGAMDHVFTICLGEGGLEWVSSIIFFSFFFKIYKLSMDFCKSKVLHIMHLDTRIPPPFFIIIILFFGDERLRICVSGDCVLWNGAAYCVWVMHFSFGLGSDAVPTGSPGKAVYTEGSRGNWGCCTSCYNVLMRPPSWKGPDWIVGQCMRVLLTSTVTRTVVQRCCTSQDIYAQ